MSSSHTQDIKSYVRVCAWSFSRVQLIEAPRTIACQAPLPMEFSRQEYWSGLPFPPPGDLPYSGIERTSLTSHALAGGFFTTSASWKVLGYRSVMLVRKPTVI